MVADHTRTIGEDAPDDPEDLLPGDSVLTLDDYLDRYAVVGHRPRYEILYRLVHSGDASPRELEAVMTIDDSTLYYHLHGLVDVGLVEKRRGARDRDGSPAGWSSRNSCSFIRKSLDGSYPDYIPG